MNKIVLFEKLQKLANQAREAGHFKEASLFSNLVVDLGIITQRENILVQHKKALEEINNLRKSAKELRLKKLADQLDIIARDLENKVISFSVDTPIEAVIESYKAIHKVAQRKQDEDILQQVVLLVEDPNLTDENSIQEIRKLMIGLPVNEKQRILYILEKDYNFEIPLEKVAMKAHEKYELEEKKKIQEERERFLEKKTFKDKASLLKEDPDAPEFHIDKSFPTAPNIWSGFAFEGTVPYSQNSQLNYWTLASKKLKPIEKLAKKK